MNAQDVFEKFLNNKKEKTIKKGKECPSCSTLVGPRTKLCGCGHEFVKGARKQFDKYDSYDQVSDEDRLYAASIGASGRIVYAPSGSTNAVISDINKNSVYDFCNFVVNEGITKGVVYTVGAIKHFIQHRYGYNTKEYIDICEFIDEWYNETLGIDYPNT